MKMQMFFGGDESPEVPRRLACSLEEAAKRRDIGA
jgi:hypothetical protein